MTLGKTVNSTFWVLLLFVRRAGQPAQPASLPTSQPASLPARLPKLSLPCRAKRGNPHSNAYPNSCVQIKEALPGSSASLHGRAPSTMGQQSKAGCSVKLHNELNFCFLFRNSKHQSETLLLQNILFWNKYSYEYHIGTDATLGFYFSKWGFGWGSN